MNLRRRNALDCLTILLSLAFSLAFVVDAFSQQKHVLIRDQRKATQGNEESTDNVFLPPDRRTLQKLSQAKELINKGRFSEAVQNLGAILEGQDDYFFQPQANQPIHRSLKAEAQRLISRMPREGRELYELQYGARAKQLLLEATTAGDAEKMAEVSRRFFHTQAGYEATFLLGLYHLDHGRPLASALVLQRLQDVDTIGDRFEPALSLAIAASWIQANAKDKAREAILAFQKNHPKMALEAADGKVQLPTKANDILGWLVKKGGNEQTADQLETEQWLMFRGNPQRNAVTSGSAPLMNLCWRVPLTDDPIIEEAIEETRRWGLEQGVAVMPGLHPLVVDDVVLMRTDKSLEAIDFNSGKRLWDIPADDPLGNLSSNSESDAISQSSYLTAVISQRTWNDATYGTLSSDGRLVFCVEDIHSPHSAIAPSFRGPASNIGNGKASNRLAAYDIRTGKLKWQLGGNAEDVGVRLAESCFLGPPLPLMGQLYILAELKGEIRLIALDAASGNTAWSQQLAVVEQNAQQDLARRFTGVTPSYADGVLVCPTSTGALVAVELATRSLLWGYVYSQPDRNDLHAVTTEVLVNHSADSGVCLADGRVVVSPVDSNSLHCLNLLDGELLWKHKRQDELYTACIYQGNIIQVGSHQMQAIRLSDGKPGWDGKPLSYPGGSMPSGRGFFTGDCYYIPLDSSVVATIDLATGKIVHTAKSRKGIIPGNLLCHKGRIISQSYDGVDVFYQLAAANAEVNRRLAANSSDSDALCLQGEIFLDSNKRTEAIGCFRRAFDIDNEPHSRELLRDTLLDGLENEFAVYQKQSQEIEQLLDDSAQKAQYFRLMAIGLRRSGDLSGAFDFCLRLVDLDSDTQPLDTVSQSLVVRRCRWIQSQLAAITSEAKGDTAEMINREVRTRMQKASAAGNIENLQRFTDYFGNLSIASEARDEIIGKLTQSQRLLEAEFTTLRKNTSLEPAMNVEALAETALMFREAGRNDSAASIYRWLSSHYANVVFQNGKTVEQIIDSLPKNNPIRESLERNDSWPSGNVEISLNEKVKNNLINSYGRLPLEFKGSPGPYFNNMNLTYDQNRFTLTCYDALGNTLWQVPLSDSRRYFGYNRGSFGHIRALGHLLLISTGNNLYAVDTLRANEKNPPKVLWSQNFGDIGGDIVGLPQIFPQGPFAAVMQRHVMQTANQKNDIEPVNIGYVCIQRSRSLMALDPLNGSTLWIRHGVPQGSVTFGDDKYIFLLPPDKPDAMVLDAIDGELLGFRKITRPEIHIEHLGAQTTNYASLSETCPLILGRYLLFWRVEKDRRILECFDPWTQKAVWPRREFSTTAQFNLLGNEAIAVIQPSGEFSIIKLTDGRVITEVKLKPESDIADLSVMHSDNGYLVLINQSIGGANTPQSRPLQPLFGTVSKPIIRGRLYGINSNGKLTWPEPIEIKDQHLLTSQPKGLPILLFACQTYELKQNNQTRLQVALQAIDKKTGREIFNKKLPKSSGVINIEGNAERKTVNLLMQNQTMTFTFTDKPIPPVDKEAEAKKEQKPKGSASKALLKSLEKTMDQMFGSPNNDEFEEEE